MRVSKFSVANVCTETVAVQKGRDDVYLSASNQNAVSLGKPRQDKQRTLQLALKRALDIGISLGALIILLPLMVLVAVLIRLDSPGPAIFSQIRWGRGLPQDQDLQVPFDAQGT